MTNTRNMSTKNLRRLTIVAVLSALIFLLTFTGWGYIPTGWGFNITILMIPVVIASIILGPTGGAVLGAVWGLSSFIAGALAMDPTGSLMIGISPIKAFITCVVPRLFVGLICGLIFKALIKIDKTKFISYAVVCMLSALLNTLLFLSFAVILYGNESFISELTKTDNFFVALYVLIALNIINAIAEAVAALVVGTAITKSISVYTKKLI